MPFVAISCFLLSVLLLLRLLLLLLLLLLVLIILLVSLLFQVLSLEISNFVLQLLYSKPISLILTSDPLNDTQQLFITSMVRYLWPSHPSLTDGALKTDHIARLRPMDS